MIYCAPFFLATLLFVPAFSAIVNKGHISSNFKLFSTPLKYGGLQHAGVLVSNTESAKQFYMDVFGFLDDTHLRPTTLPYPGAFLRCGADQIHLMELPSMDPKEGILILRCL